MRWGYDAAFFLQCSNFIKHVLTSVTFCIGTLLLYPGAKEKQEEENQEEDNSYQGIGNYLHILQNTDNIHIQSLNYTLSAFSVS